MLHNVGAVDCFPLEVASDFRVQEHFDEETVCHDEFGDQINIPVSIVPVVRGRFGPRAELLPQVGQVQ